MTSVLQRQELIQMIYDTNEFPNSMKNIYSDVYYAFIHIMKMEEADFKLFFPNFLSPCDYRFSEEYASHMLPFFFENARIDILNDILFELERIFELANSTEFNDFDY